LLPFKLAKWGCLLLLLAIIAFYFYGLGYLPLVGPDEPRYVQVAREMFQRGDLITPTLGGHTWFEKPALLYWIMGLSFRLFGISEWSARLGPAICGVLTIVPIYWVGRRVEVLSGDPDLRHLGCLSALVLATTPGMIAFSKGASFDIVVTMTTTWALSCVLLAELEPSDVRRRWLLIAGYVFVGMSLLAKGLVGLLIPSGVLVFYYLLRRSLPPRWFLSSLLWGLPITIAVAAFWYAPVISKHGWVFIDEFFIQHHFARYLSNKYHHPQPFFYYLLIIFPLALPWLIFAIDAIRRIRHSTWREKTPVHRLRAFAFAWFIMPLLFFSLSGSKLPGYILPVLPALALLSGERVARFVAGREGTSPVLVITALLILFSLGAITYTGATGELSVKCAILIVSPLLVASIVVLFSQHKRVLAMTLIAVAIPMAFLVALNCGIPQLAQRHSAQQLVARARERGYGSAPVYSLHEIDRGTEYYAAGRVVYDSEGQPLKLEGPYEVLEAAKERNGPVLVMVPLQYLDQLLGLPSADIDVIANNEEVAIAAVRARN
jgi:4-amino-4-deoxy-L-arabinose transferase-like glycosyltransferase